MDIKFGYSIVLEDVTSISSEVTNALGITQSAIANGGGSSVKDNTKNDETSPENKRGIEGKCWRSDKTWKQNVKKVDEGSTIHELNGQVPTEQEAIDLINEAGGIVNRIEGPHNAPNPHDFNHINYATSNGGTIKIK